MEYQPLTPDKRVYCDDCPAENSKKCIVYRFILGGNPEKKFYLCENCVDEGIRTED